MYYVPDGTTRCGFLLNHSIFLKKDGYRMKIQFDFIADVLISATGESDVNAVYCDENVWLTQKMMGLLYNVETHTINYHLIKYLPTERSTRIQLFENFE